MINVSFRYKGEPDERLYGLKASFTKREQDTVRRIQKTTRELSEEIVSHVRGHWSGKSPASAGRPPAVVSGNLDSSSYILDRDATGRFTSSKNAVASTVIWDARRGDNYHGRGEYAAVQEYGLDGLKAPHPFLQPAIDAVSSMYIRKLKDAL